MSSMGDKPGLKSYLRHVDCFGLNFFSKHKTLHKLKYEDMDLFGLIDQGWPLQLPSE